jgi:pimeloyl-ACP methyl ester carboxylesterase
VIPDPLEIGDHEQMESSVEPGPAGAGRFTLRRQTSRRASGELSSGPAYEAGADRSFRIPGRVPVPPLRPEWLVVDEIPLFHRYCLDAAPDADAIVHVHGFGISGTYLEPTAARLASRYRTFVPDLPGIGRSMRPRRGLDLAGLASALMDYCDSIGVERPILVGNSLGCPVIIEVAARFPERVKRAVLVSPAGGPNNQPLGRALHQIALDGLREPLSLTPIATRDYLRFGVLQSLSLFKAMTEYPTLENLHKLEMPTLVIAGLRDPLVRISRGFVLASLPHVNAVKVPGAHALNYSAPELIAELIDAHLTDQPLLGGPHARGVAEIVDVQHMPPSELPRRLWARRREHPGGAGRARRRRGRPGEEPAPSSGTDQ